MLAKQFIRLLSFLGISTVTVAVFFGLLLGPERTTATIELWSYSLPFSPFGESEKVNQGEAKLNGESVQIRSYETMRTPESALEDFLASCAGDKWSVARDWSTGDSKIGAIANATSTQIMSASWNEDLGRTQVMHLIKPRSENEIRKVAEAIARTEAAGSRGIEELVETPDNFFGVLKHYGVPLDVIAGVAAGKVSPMEALALASPEIANEPMIASILAKIDRNNTSATEDREGCDIEGIERFPGSVRMSSVDLESIRGYRSVTYHSDGGVSQVAGYYIDRLAADGWRYSRQNAEIITSSGRGDTGMMFRKDDHAITLGFAERDGGVDTTIVRVGGIF
jgi:hypothetical protein